MKKVTLLILAGLIIMALGAMTLSFAAENDIVRRMGVVRSLADRMCIRILPSLDTFPGEKHYSILADALAARGVKNFVGTNPADDVTIGEIKEIFFQVTSGGGIPATGKKAECPVQLTALFALDPGTKLTEKDFQKILGCFPDCDPNAEPYTAPPPEGNTPEGPVTTLEEPASQIK